MSSASDIRALIRHDARTVEIEMLADDFLAFVDAFEVTLSDGAVPPEFAERLANLHQRADRLI
ncbi:hypothetical protein LZ496_12605 [Sphingomonas sp. NSE70-1]|uniref:Uncharacterized protein n=1 Tax=Sphingomonas caseinilyticus TaxID=2908205 RepID=A0ABT0RX68_9SPHN|nr:hypothetical protein [Sphingomonas caseinilyticus]MCL6699619.1 hypothetical protein [Sphingomonas caseinilyticus]